MDQIGPALEIRPTAQVRDLIRTTTCAAEIQVFYQILLFQSNTKNMDLSLSLLFATTLSDSYYKIK